MTNPEARVQYEGAILQQLIKNAEELAVIKPKINKIDVLEQKVDNLENKVDNLENKVDKIYSAIGTIRWLTITIAIGIVINIFSQPIVSYLF